MDSGSIHGRVEQVARVLHEALAKTAMLGRTEMVWYRDLQTPVVRFCAVPAAAGQEAVSLMEVVDRHWIEIQGDAVARRMWADADRPELTIFGHRIEIRYFGPRMYWRAIPDPERGAAGEFAWEFRCRQLPGGHEVTRVTGVELRGVPDRQAIDRWLVNLSFEEVTRGEMVDQYRHATVYPYVGGE